MSAPTPGQWTARQSEECDWAYVVTVGVSAGRAAKAWGSLSCDARMVPARHA